MADAVHRERTAEEQAQYDKLVGTPIPKLIPKLAVPTVLSMMITMLYNLADSYFVGKLGTSASASIGIVMAVLATYQAFGFLFGHGAGAVMSRQLGRGEQEAASKTTSTAFFATVVLGFLISVIGLIFVTPLMRLLGSTETILPYAVEYARCIFLSGTFFCSSCVLNNVLRYEGRAFNAMIGLVSGSVLNIFLDPLFIFGFNMGIRGAGLATALSQTISFLLLLSMYLRGKTISKLSVKNIDLKHKETTVRVVQNGFPSLVRQLLGMFGTTFLNIGARPYGDAAIAAMTIDGRVSMFLFAFVLGIGQGYQPVAAYNHGAGREDRVREGYWFTLISSEVVVGILAVLAIIFAEPSRSHRRRRHEVLRHRRVLPADGRLHEHDVPVDRQCPRCHLPVLAAQRTLLRSAPAYPAPRHRAPRHPECRHVVRHGDRFDQHAFCVELLPEAESAGKTTEHANTIKMTSDTTVPEVLCLVSGFTEGLCSSGSRARISQSPCHGSAGSSDRPF